MSEGFHRADATAANPDTASMFGAGAGASKDFREESEAKRTGTLTIRASEVFGFRVSEFVVLQQTIIRLGWFRKTEVGVVLWWPVRRRKQSATVWVRSTRSQKRKFLQATREPVRQVR